MIDRLTQENEGNRGVPTLLPKFRAKLMGQRQLSRALLAAGRVKSSCETLDRFTVVSAQSRNLGRDDEVLRSKVFRAVLRPLSKARFERI
jgi:hypothetical protein